MMKNLLIILLLISSMLLSACSVEKEKSKLSEQEKLNQTESSEQPTQSEREIITVLSNKHLDAEINDEIDITEADLNNLVVMDKQPLIYTNDGKQGLVYLLSDYLYGRENIQKNSYLVYELEEKTLLYDLCVVDYASAMTFCNIDGDVAQEIVLQQTVGMSGGAGHYESRIFKIENDSVVVLFNAETYDEKLERNVVFDTGFEHEFLKNKILKIKNRFTQYSLEIDVSQKYIDSFFDEQGMPIRETTLWCDTFFEFSAVDIDNDAIFEIVCSQYVSLDTHASGVGVAKSILKYNTETKSFDVIDADFEY